MSTNTTTAKQLEVQRIAEILSKAIAQQRLRPGTRLVESQLVDALGANRNHVQVALQRLAMQRIVTIEPNRGAMVSQPTAKEAREVFIARRAIERAIVESITQTSCALIVSGSVVICVTNVLPPLQKTAAPSCV